MSDEQSPWVQLSSGDLTAEISPLGAQLSALRDRTGRDLLWNGDPAYGRMRESHFIEFENDEPAPMRRLNADGLLTPERHPTPISHRRLALTDSLFRDDVMIFDDIRSRFVTYGADDGPRIEIGYPDSPFLGIWTRPQANFICIEPWHGIADLEGFRGDFTAKTGVFTLAAGAALPIKMTICVGTR